MQKRDGRGETEANTKGGTEEAKGGEEMQKINREDVVQAALIVERWCAGQDCRKCPLMGEYGQCMITGVPEVWGLENKLRTRGLDDD